MFLTRFRNITLLISTLLLCFSMQLYAVVIYETDFMASPPNASTTTAKGEFTTTMPAWTPVPSFSSAYLTTGSSGACTITFTKALDLSKYKDVQILIDYGSESSRPLLVNVNGDGDVSVHTMVSTEKKTVIHTSLSTSAASISTIHVHSSGGGAVYFFHLAIIGTPLTQENELKWSDGLTDGATVNKFITDPSFTYTATATLSTGAISYSSSNPDVATVNGTTGQVTLVATGDAIITAHQQAQGTYPDTSITYNLHVTELTNILTWSGGLTDGASVTKSLSEGSVTYTASANLSTGAITYSSSDPTVATVDANGKVTFLKAGSTTITATQAATALYESTSISYELTISAADCSQVTIKWTGKQEGRIIYANTNFVEVNGKKYYAPGFYEEYTKYNTDGCPTEGYVAVIGADTTDFYCKGSTYYWRGLETTSSTKTLTYKSEKVKYGSSSYQYTINNFVTRVDATQSTTIAHIDFGESYEWFGKTYQKTGTYKDTITNMYGCDSIGTLTLTVCGEATGDTIVGICKNQGQTSVTVWGETFYAPANRTRIFQTSYGCDSLVTLHVVESAPTAGVEKVTINKGESYYWRYTETSYTTTQDVTVTLKNYCGCDSTLTLHLIVQDIPADGKHLAKTICDGDVYTWHGTSYTQAGTYAASDCDSVLHLGVLPNPNIEVCDDKVMDYKSSTTLWVGGADYYAWDNDHALSSEWADQPDAFPDTTTVFHVKSYNSAAANTISNGDFEMGKAGSPAGSNPQFTTEAIWSTASGTYGKYIIANNTNEMWSEDNFYDHTYGTEEGNMMVVDGFSEPDKIIWQQTVSVSPKTDYIFSAWFLSLKSSFSKNSFAKFQFFVNGEQLGPITEAPKTRGKWGRYYELWDSGDATTAILTIKNQNTDEKGNDFALDDISFQALGPCFGFDSVKVTTNFNIDLYGDGKMVIEQRSDYVDSQITYHIEHHPDGQGNYHHGDQITVRVYNTECAEFVGWSDGEIANPRVFQVGETDIVQPIFVGEPFTITTNQIGEGNVTGGQQYWCKDTAIVTATPDPCWQFIKWKEDGNTNPVRTFEVTKEHTLTAIFERIPYYITIKTANGSQGKVGGQVNTKQTE